MLWPVACAEFLAGGGRPNYQIALLLSPVLRSSGLREDLGYWSGHEDIVLPLGGADRTLWATYGALQSAVPSYVAGTTIRTHSISAFGLSPQSIDLLQAYEVRFAPAQEWQLMFTQGAEFIGARRIMSGTVDIVTQTIGKKGEGASLTLQIATSARAGTASIIAKKSDQSYRQRDGDTAMEYASLVDADSDWWGPRG